MSLHDQSPWQLYFWKHSQHSCKAENLDYAFQRSSHEPAVNDENTAVPSKGPLKGWETWCLWCLFICIVSALSSLLPYYSHTFLFSYCISQSLQLLGNIVRLYALTHRTVNKQRLWINLAIPTWRLINPRLFIQRLLLTFDLCIVAPFFFQETYADIHRK